jgi:hypothetical protein
MTLIGVSTKHLEGEVGELQGRILKINNPNRIYGPYKYPNLPYTT